MLVHVLKSDVAEVSLFLGTGLALGLTKGRDQSICLKFQEDTLFRSCASQALNAILCSYFCDELDPSDLDLVRRSGSAAEDVRTLLVKPDCGTSKVFSGCGRCTQGISYVLYATEYRYDLADLILHGSDSCDALPSSELADGCPHGLCC